MLILFHIFADLSKFFQKTALNYIACDDPVGTVIQDRREAVPMVSAGHVVHEWTSASAFEHLFKMLEKKRRQATSPVKQEKGGLFSRKK